MSGPNRHGTKLLPGLEAFCDPSHQRQSGSRFGRLFDSLEPFWCDPELLTELGAPGGPMATEDPPARTESVPVGFVFFGQFIDHDITLDLTSSLDTVSEADDLPNARTPTLDLDCVYGSGPEGSRTMYDGARLVTAHQLGKSDFEADDLPRVRGVALIGDFRNDENRVVSQLQLAMIRYHNAVCDQLEVSRPGISAHDLFEEARRHCTWHYQRTIINEFLPAICGRAVVQRILAEGPRFYRPHDAFIPVEFSAAAYRFGHAMVPQRICVQAGQPDHELFGSELGSGFSPVPSQEAIVEWDQLVPTPGAVATQMTHRCGPMLSDGLLELSASVDSGRRSLAALNMLRGQALLLPSGESVARAMGFEQAHVDEVSDSASHQARGHLPGATPLWFWLLNEAAVVGRESAPGEFEPGEGLGPVGATIVAEVLIGLMSADPRSWFNSDRNWLPEPDQRTIGQLLTYSPVLNVGRSTKV